MSQGQSDESYNIYYARSPASSKYFEDQYTPSSTVQSTGFVDCDRTWQTYAELCGLRYDQPSIDIRQQQSTDPRSRVSDTGSLLTGIREHASGEFVSRRAARRHDPIVFCQDVQRASPRAYTNGQSQQVAHPGLYWRAGPPAQGPGSLTNSNANAPPWAVCQASYPPAQQNNAYNSSTPSSWAALGNGSASTSPSNIGPFLHNSFSPVAYDPRYGALPPEQDVAGSSGAFHGINPHFPFALRDTSYTTDTQATLNNRSVGSRPSRPIPTQPRSFYTTDTQANSSNRSDGSRPPRQIPPRPLSLSPRSPEEIVYHCNNCDKTFTREEDVARHKPTKHRQPGASVYRCDQCPYNYPRKDKVRDRCRRHHDDENAFSEFSGSARVW